MSLKRPRDTSAPPSHNDEDDSASPPQLPGSPKTAWTPDEEARYLDAIDAVVKNALWSHVKNDPELAKRGANGIRSHWDAMIKKMKKGGT
ncbi:hypothetical protein EHS25_003217 [Saitozyma podzolica]|uniref:Myb-like domain-containing protein n=1 Tax=Saitozyma podzolica TaxID=1890683 RepID=A0A427Y889_9TREE|nr:hypothetical protein EHS25_003217 [Saitozyma podzolica]